jgi:hypothetical protein
MSRSYSDREPWLRKEMTGKNKTKLGDHNKSKQLNK